MGKFRKSDDLLYWRFFLILYLTGFAVGIVFTNLAWEYRPGDLDALTVFSLQEGVRIRGSGYLWYLTRRNGAEACCFRLSWVLLCWGAMRS